ncbi:hypothetical protein OG401_11875 [Kitasatospora purpeofusca]|uniref:hypothetical protein n=1 Tax=Kitasatospora purpeofusca TaxID=67352 RepID=UPI00225261AC|nr:hypothetical protein [Kitasatospora purpeofusca]MCX4684998.1 hypothetical protein [Kitasatospora purpeofusca]
MTERVTVRVGPESVVLVLGTGRDRLREVARDLRRELVPSVLGPQLILLPLGTAAGVFAHLALGLGTGAAVGLVGAATLLEVLALALLAVGDSLARPGLLEFSPPQAPVRMRAVRAGRPGRWRPVAALGEVRVDHRVTEPVDGDPRPPAETFTVSARDYLTRALSVYDVPGNPRLLVAQLAELLEPAGVPVVLQSARYAWRRGGPPVLLSATPRHAVGRGGAPVDGEPKPGAGDGPPCPAGPS